MEPDITGLRAAAEYVGESTTETRLGREMAEKAKRYLEAFPWCGGVQQFLSGIDVPGVIGVYLAQVQPERNADPWVWIVYGDIPPAYIAFDVDDTPNAACALDAYIGEMDKWVDAVRRGAPTDRLIPVNAPPSSTTADNLASRLRTIDLLILSPYADDLRRTGTPLDPADTNHVHRAD